MSQYYIFYFYDNDVGNQMRFDLSGYPNGTVFSRCPLYVNSKKDVWITYSYSNNLESISSSIEWITKDGGVQVIATGVTEIIEFPKNVTIDDTDKLKEYDDSIVEMFKKFAPHLCFD